MTITTRAMVRIRVNFTSAIDAVDRQRSVMTDT